MGSKIPILLFNIVSLALRTYAAIGPVADLHIVNKDHAPDGVMRPTILAGGTVPGPLIVGNKVKDDSLAILIPFVF